jgi:hypothetical protein
MTIKAFHINLEAEVYCPERINGGRRLPDDAWVAEK